MSSRVSKIALLGLLLSLILVTTAHAQAGRRVIRFCFDNKSGAVTPTDSSGSCKTGKVFSSLDASVNGTFYGVCVSTSEPYSWKKPTVTSSTSGKATCGSGERLIGPAEFTATTKPTTSTPPRTEGGKETKTEGGSTTSSETGGGATPIKCEEGYEQLGPTCVPKSPFTGGIAGTTSLKELIPNILKILLGLAGVFSVVMIIIGGYQFMSAAGNATQAVNARKTLTNAIIGLVVTIFSYAIVQVIVNYITSD